MSEKTLISAFGHIIPPTQVITPGQVTTKIIKYEPVLVEGTGRTEPKVTQEIDLQEIIDSYRDQCGMELAQRLIRSGQVSSDAFADDGQHGGDITAFADYIGDLQTQTIAAQEEAAKIKAALGLTDEDVASPDIAAIIEKKLSEIIAAQTQTASADEGENK